MAITSALFILALLALAVLFAIAKANPTQSAREPLEKIYRLLQDEEIQIAAFPGLKERLKENDASRSVSGLYGLTPKDPIRVNGPIGELIYISRLVSSRGFGFIGHRLGSIGGLDAFEIASTDFSDWRVLWLDMYWQIKDLGAPAGLRLTKQVEPWPDGALPGLSATNRFLANFPHDYWPDILSSTQAQLGFPCVKTSLKTLDTSGVVRPPEHAEILQKVVVMARAEGLGVDS